jgi:hypothetical protein
VQVGDCVPVRDSKTYIVRPARVVSMSNIVRSGAYAPLTDDGRLVVNDILVSCYAVVHDHQLAHGYFQLLSTLNRWFGGLADVTSTNVHSGDTHLPAYVQIVFDSIHHLLPGVFYSF